MFTELSYFAAQMISITCLAILSASLLLTNPKNLNAWLGSVICISTITYLVSTMQYQSNPQFRIDLSAYWLPMQFLMNTGSGALMILCHSMFQDQNRFPRWLLALLVIQLSISTVRPIFVPNELAQIDVNEIGAEVLFMFGSLPILMQAFFALTGGYWVIKGWKIDVVEDRRILRIVVVSMLIILFVLFLLSEAFVFNVSEQQRLVNAAYQTYGGTLLIFLITLTALQYRVFVERAVRTINAGVTDDVSSEEEIDLDHATFERVFIKEKVYLEPGLSIADLAKKMSVLQYRLRRLVNEKLGYRNFNSLLNEYRIRDACTALEDPDNSQTPVLTIALSQGYQSIAPFNQAFKEILGMTPTEFRKQALQDAARAAG